MSEPGLRVDGVTFRVGSRAIVDDVSVSVAPGETLALVGPSGCGKTTLLRMIAGLERPTAGRVVFDGEDVTGVPAYRRRFGMMFQEFALFPHLTVEQNVAFGLRHSQIPAARHTARVAELLELTGMRGFEKRTVEKLSGGERQRVALARSLAPEPRLLMLDEPLGSLDRALRERLLVELKVILERLGVPAVYVTHDQFEAFAMGTRMAVMRAGRVEREGTPREVYESPRTEFVATFLGMENIVDGVAGELGLVTTGWGKWLVEGAHGGNVRLLLRNEGVSLAKEPGNGTVEGIAEQVIFQGAHVRLVVVGPAGRLEFALPAGSALPQSGEAVQLHVPRVQLVD